MIFSKNIALALGGGATKVFATIGIIEELEKEKISFSAFSGASAGAIVAAYYALYGEISSLKKKWFSFSQKDWKNFVDMKFPPISSLVKGVQCKNHLYELFGEKTFADTKTPLYISATCLETGKPEYINSGSIVDALLASTAYPGIFPPHRIKQKTYVDGGVLDNLPYSVLLEKKYKKVIAISLNNINIEEKPFNTAFSVVQRSIDLMIDNAFKSIPKENNSLFMFSVSFPPENSSLWNSEDITEKYIIGKKSFQEQKTSFLKWHSFDYPDFIQKFLK